MEVELIDLAASLHVDLPEGHASSAVDTVRYSVPERLVGKTVTVYKHYERVEIHHRGAVVASHDRVIGERDVRRTLPGHHTVPQRAPREPALAEPVPARGAQGAASATPAR